jgi:hypothetical protein
MKCYICEFAEDCRITLAEHMDARFVSRENIRELKWLAADLPVIERLIARGILGFRLTKTANNDREKDREIG